MKLSPITGAIFDVDGTLLDSMGVWNGLAERYLLSKGIEPELGLSDKLKTFTVTQAAQYYREKYDLRLEAEQIIRETNMIISDYYRQRASLKPGVEALLRALKSKGVRMCIATATDRELIEPALKRTGIEGYFSRMFCGDDIKTGKDSPEIFIRALEHLKTDINSTWVFEDALHAAETARNAGFKVVGVYDKYTAQNPLLKKAVDVYLKSFEELDLMR